jgi:hypothetical protein
MPATAVKPTVFERGDHLYIVSPVATFSPGDEEIEEFAFADDLRKQAPSTAIKWLQGQYVEADHPNLNGQVWTSGELAIKSLTPMFMPVTVMHDKRSAVGLIADTRLLVPEKDGVPRSRIDNTLAIWAHRFPEVAEEIDANYEQGTLMQSMEAVSPFYDCATCGKTFHKLPDGAERANWCDHLIEGAGLGARILRNVVFTGTGLIFGTRGKEGANPNAHLDVFQDEVAEFHERAHRDAGRSTGTTRSDKPKRRSKKRMSEIEINAEEYAELKARPTKADFETAEKRAKTAEDELAESKRKVESAEAAQKKAEEERDEKDKELKKAEEAQAQATLRDERIGKLGDGFMAKLGETTRSNLKEDAGSMEDEAWEKRLSEVEELSSTKRDAKLDPKKGGGGKPEPSKNGNGGGDGGSTEAASTEEDEFSVEELAESIAGGGSDGSGDGGGMPSSHQRRSLARGLVGSGSKPKDE